MKKCPYCNNLVPDVAHYCTKCGKNFTDSESDAVKSRQAAPPELLTSFKVDLKKLPGPPQITVLVLKGDIDTAGTRILQNTLRRCTINVAPRVILDFVQVNRACSAAYSAILSWVRERESDLPNSVAIVGVRENIMHELSSMGIAVCLPIFEDGKEALRSLLGA